MKTASHSLVVAMPLAVVLATAAPSALADIAGFPIPGWQLNQWDGASGSPVNPPESITLTTGTSGQSRSAFYTTRQDITTFEASFTYTFTGNANGRMGAAFVLHNSPEGPEAVAYGTLSGVTTNFGYTDGRGTFGNRSVAISLESGYSGAGSSATGVYTYGSFGGGSTPTSPIQFSSGNPIDVTIAYNGFLLSMTARDTVTGSLFTAPLVAIDLSTVLNDGSAFVGFTGSTNTNAGTSQTFSNFRYTTVPAPAAGGLLAAGLLVAVRRRR